MASKRAAIAQAVVNALTAAKNADRFSQTFAVSRKYVPAAELKDLETLTLTVVPLGPEKRATFDRGRTRKDFSVEIGVQKRLAQTTDPASVDGNDDIDALMQFAEELADWFDPINPAAPKLQIAGSDLRWAGSEIDPAYDLTHLQTQRVFTSRVVLTYFYF